jgi:hypothetical protein
MHCFFYAAVADIFHDVTEPILDYDVLEYSALLYVVLSIT